MPRPQFTLRALLVAMLVVAAFLGGMAVQAKIKSQREKDLEGIVRELRNQINQGVVDYSPLDERQLGLIKEALALEEQPEESYGPSD